MKIIYCAVFILLLSSFNSEKKEKPISQVIKESLDFSIKQYLSMADSLKDKPGLLPRSTDMDGKLVTCKSDWWVSGFYPGSLWYLYEYSNNAQLKKLAQDFTERVRDQQYTTGNHDVGFMIYCSFGNGYRITHNPDYKNVILTASKSLSTRFNPKVGCIRSWDFGPWQYPVIIDNMMNLELLFFASHTPGYEIMYKMAASHADVTLKNHFRPDGSCYHVVSYDTITGKAVAHQTRQGYADGSSWARGQGWALYGFTMCYRETRDPKYLDHAKKVAAFILNHPRLPEDKIPYWDFDDPAIPNTLRDASAGAVICSALVELSQYVDKDLSKTYLAVAEKQIRALSSPAYRANAGENCNFILKHSVGDKPRNSEVDTPLTYADYYFIEAMMRYKNLMEKKK